MRGRSTRLRAVRHEQTCPCMRPPRHELRSCDMLAPLSTVNPSPRLLPNGTSSARKVLALHPGPKNLAPNGRVISMLAAGGCGGAPAPLSSAASSSASRARRASLSCASFSKRSRDAPTAV